MESLTQDQIMAVKLNLINAIESGNIEAVIKCFDNGVDVNCRILGKMSTLKFSPLYFALECNALNIAKFLLERKADPNIGLINLTQGGGLTPLSYAVKKGKLDLVQFLLDMGADINMVYGIGEDTKTALGEAIQLGNLEMAGYLLDRGANVNLAYGSDVETPLSHAVANRNLEVVQFLLGRGADISLVDKNHKTPIHKALLRDKNGNTLQLLLGNIKNINLFEANLGEENPALLASALSIKGNFKNVQLLLDAGVDLSKPDKNGDTPLNIAVKQNDPNLVLLLLQKGADPNLCNKKGITPLVAVLYSVSGGNFFTNPPQIYLNIARLLLDAGADPNKKSQEEESPINIITKNSDFYDKRFPQLVEALKTAVPLKKDSVPKASPVFASSLEESRIDGEPLAKKVKVEGISAGRKE